MIKVPVGEGLFTWVNPAAIKTISEDKEHEYSTLNTTIDLGNGDDVRTNIPADDIAKAAALALKQMTYELNYKKGK